MPERVFLVRLDVESELPDDLTEFAHELKHDIESKGWTVVDVKTWGDSGQPMSNGPLGQTLGDFF
jgi:hypothetical protein